MTTAAATSSGSGSGGVGGQASTTSASEASSSASSTSSASSAASTTAASTSASSGTGGCAPYGHAIAIDGTDDFNADEDFTTTSVGFTGHIAWDATAITIGMTGADVASNSSTRWFEAYISGTGGTTTGVTYNTETPTLPFPAKWHVRWKADNSFTDALIWNGTMWAEAGWDFTGQVFQTGNYVEIRIPRTNIGSPTSVNMVLAMLNEQGGAEGTFAGVPQTAFTDGLDPNFTHYFSFDLDGCLAPAMFAPI
jgi:hypothetical protein